MARVYGTRRAEGARMSSPRKIVVDTRGSVVFIGVQYQRQDDPRGKEHRPGEAIKIAGRILIAALRAMIGRLRVGHR